MAVTEIDKARVVRLLLHDVHATRRTEHDQIVIASATRLLALVHEPDEYVRRVVEDTQQEPHDRFIDTAWPRMPGYERIAESRGRKGCGDLAAGRDVEASVNPPSSRNEPHSGRTPTYELEMRKLTEVL